MYIICTTYHTYIGHVRKKNRWTKREKSNRRFIIIVKFAHFWSSELPLAPPYEQNRNGYNMRLFTPSYRWVNGIKVNPSLAEISSVESV